MQLNQEHIYDCQRHPLLPTAEGIFDFSKYPSEPNWDAFDRHMDSVVREITRKLAEQVRQQAIDFIGKQKEEPTMRASYNGFTGRLEKLERKITAFGCGYDISIYDSEKQVTHSFIGVKLEDVKFLGGAVSFGG